MPHGAIATPLGNEWRIGEQGGWCVYRGPFQATAKRNKDRVQQVPVDYIAAASEVHNEAR